MREVVGEWEKSVKNRRFLGEAEESGIDTEAVGESLEEGETDSEAVSAFIASAVDIKCGC